jgi:hypothetical protein
MAVTKLGYMLEHPVHLAVLLVEALSSNTNSDNPTSGDNQQETVKGQDPQRLYARRI